VKAIGPGVVSFAGPVAGRIVATIRHPGGLRSSYTGLAGLAVRRGDRVDGGQIVGLAAGPLHLGVRRGDRYLDPASLFGRPVGGGRAILVPDRAPGRPPPHAPVGRRRPGFLQSVMAADEPP
jgi:murein DD-endopeptidase MepM/ murein hydrolase activator NlpD